MSTAAPIAPARTVTPSRLRSFIAFVLALMYVFAAQTIARHAASGLSSGDWVLLIDRLILLFLLMLGFSALAVAFARQREPRRALGLISRPGMAHEFGAGAAVGWALMLAIVLPSVFIGGWSTRLWTGSHQWLLLMLDLVVLLISALCTELVFRGFAFQQLMDAIGTTLATVFISVCFVAVEYDPEMPHAAIFALFLLSVILCMGYLRTRALWLPWGLHFAWNAAMGPLFGLPLSGITGRSSFTPVVQTVALGPDFVTGGDYGPEGSGIAVLVLLFLGIWLIQRGTREFAARYSHPEIIPGGIPVDVDAMARRQHEAAMGPVVAEPAAPRLVQIGGVAPAGSPPSPAIAERPAED